MNKVRWYKKDINLLSPWERARIIFSLFNLNRFNTLVLDEPTNHLDLEAIEELIRTLSDFKWTLILVSHDINFIKSIKNSNFYIVENWSLKEIVNTDKHLATN